ncbi:MAG: hypothetical protein ABR990_10895 [Terracidiphilus sp.]
MADSGVSTATYWLPLVTALLGFASGAFSEWVRDRRAYGREKEARDSLQRAQRLEQRDSFQRQTLLDLQASLMKLMQSTHAIYRIDMSNLNNFGKRDVGLYPPGASNECMQDNARTWLLNVRVRDEAVRNLTQRFKGKLTEATESSCSQEAAQKAMCTAELCFIALNERIGEVLRSLDDAEY